MFEDMAPKLARIITEYSEPVHKDDFVILYSGFESAPLVLAMQEAIMRRGGHLYIQTSFPGTIEQFFILASDDQLTWINPVTRVLMEAPTVLYSIRASSNNRTMTTIDPAKLQKRQQAYRELDEIEFRRMEDGELRWCVFPWPTEVDAQQADMGLLSWTKFIYEACALHLDDPLQYWLDMRDRQQRLVEYLAGKSEIQVKGPGIDLSLHVKGRTWVNACGTRNFPDGEIFTGPIENSVNGTIEFNYPTVYRGREVNGVRLQYEDGVIVGASADKGEGFLLTMLDTDEGARRMGEFAIGTNDFIQTFTGNTLYDEKIGGTIHMAIGRSIPESGGVNKSQVHWDMVHDMRDGGEILIDGEVFYRAGNYLV